MRVGIGLLLAVLAAQPAAAQDGAAMLQIVNAGINLGWVDGIVASEGSGANVAEIGPALGNATAAITALIPLIQSPPYETRGYVRANELIAALAAGIGTMPVRQIRQKISQILRQLQLTLDVYLDARTRRLTAARTCEGAMLLAGYAFGLGHTAIQRGNVSLDRTARSRFNQAIASGEGAERQLACDFPNDLRTLPQLRVPNPTNYANALPALQTGATTGTAPTIAPVGVPTRAPSASSSSMTSSAMTVGTMTTVASPRVGRYNGWGRIELRGGNGRYEGSYTDTYTRTPGTITLTLQNGRWRGTWGEPNIGRRGNLIEVNVSADGRRISGRYDVTADGGRGNQGVRSFNWRFAQ